MKKIITITAMLMVLLAPVFADTNVSMTVVSNSNVTTNTTVYAENVTAVTNVNAKNFQWWINGYPGTVPIIKKGLDIRDLIWDTESAIKYIFGQQPTYNIYGMRILQDLSKVFVTRAEYQQQQTNMEYLLLRVNALEHAVERINQTAYCQGKIDTMIQYNLTSVKCGNTTYYNDQRLGVYGISPSQ